MEKDDEVTGPPPKPTYNDPVGGPGGRSFDLFPPSASTVKTIELYKAEFRQNVVITGVRLTWFNDQSSIAGEESGTKASYTFAADEKITTMSVRYCDYLDHISFETTKGSAFRFGGGGGIAEPRYFNLGNGKLIGFVGKCASVIDSLGAVFN